MAAPLAGFHHYLNVQPLPAIGVVIGNITFDIGATNVLLAGRWIEAEDNLTINGVASSAGRIILECQTNFNRRQIFLIIMELLPGDNNFVFTPANVHSKW